jgi:hypothetical protein
MKREYRLAKNTLDGVATTPIHGCEAGGRIKAKAHGVHGQVVNSRS